MLCISRDKALSKCKHKIRKETNKFEQHSEKNEKKINEKRKADERLGVYAHIIN